MRKPPLVERAESLGFERSCEPEVGWLLHVLAAQRGRGRVGEIGTGAGVGTAWLASALRPGAPLYTVQLGLQGRAGLFDVLHGDRRELEAEAPFDLLFVDAAPAKADPETIGLLAPGGTAVLDDLTPGYADPDPVRELWLGHPYLVAAELVVAPEAAVIVAVRFR